jgi:dihydrofolate reductase
MDGGTVFHFVTDGIEAALARAREAADGRDVRVGGGVATIQQYLNARLIDHMHIVVTPVLLGGGEPLFAGIDLPLLGYEVAEHVPSEKGHSRRTVEGSHSRGDAANFLTPRWSGTVQLDLSSRLVITYR